MQIRRGGAALAEEIGYPVIIKASAGGGGRGMRVVRDASELEANLAQAQTEAGAAFSCADVYIEKFIEAPAAHRVPGDRRSARKRGSARRARVLHPAPAPEADRRSAIAGRQRRSCATRRSKTLREAMRAIGYTNAGTVEFLMDEKGKLYFIEVNARIQVEHPVTEAITGVDLVKSQILIAAGAKLPDILPQPVTIRGHAIECRINAEHPETFVPSPGRITGLESARRHRRARGYRRLCRGVVPPYYDSLVAKLIVHGKDRDGSDRPHEAGAQHVRRRRHPHVDPAASANPDRSAIHRRRSEYSLPEQLLQKVSVA